MSSPKMAMSTDFLQSFAQLPAQQQRGVQTMTRQFERHSKASGLNYERIRNAKDPAMRSLRIDQDYRAIVLKPASGDIHLLLWADKHDAAYRWATRHVCRINAETGALQVYEPQEVSAPDDAAPADSEGPFAALKVRELERLGVPREMAPEVRALAGEKALENIRSRLPAEAYEALFLYLAGDSYEALVQQREALAEPVDTGDFDSALGRDESRSRFVVIDDDLELQAMFNAPLETWRVFLHPSQRRLVERHWNGPVRVLGGAGTGKTVVAMHRARWLARNLPGNGRILFTTFTRNLAADIEHNLRKICSPEEMQRIETTNLDRWVQRLLHGRRYRFRLALERDQDAWQAAMRKAPGEFAFPDRFYAEEWDQVVQAHGVTTRDEYLQVPRTGRGIALTRSRRAHLWPVFEEYRAQLAERGVMEMADCYRAAAALLAENRRGADYASVVVDEAQDLTAPAWRLLRSIAPEGADDLFIVGDAHQRIYERHRVVLGSHGIHIRGRGRKLRLNYRTTEETHRWAAEVLTGRMIDDLDGGPDDQSRIYSAAHGPDPEVKQFASREEQAAWIVAYLAALTDDGEPLRSVCIVARTGQERDALRRAVDAAGVETEVLERNTPDESTTGVRLATMHRVKGLEFDRVIVASANADQLPLAAAMAGAEVSARGMVETTERSLLYVAATRAKKQLTVTSFGQPSRFVSGV